MRNHFLGLSTLILLGGLAGILTMTLTHGQVTPPRELPGNLPVDLKNPAKSSSRDIRPVAATGNPVASKSTVAAPVKSRQAAFDRYRNMDALPELTRQIVMTTQTGIEWLQRYNQPHGLFWNGYLPAVNQLSQDEHFLHQAMATFVLARAARFTGEERYIVRANQAVLAILSNTIIDPASPGVRRTAQPSVVCNRLAAVGFIVLAIHELPEPAQDLLGKAEELCAFIRSQQREDGSLNYMDGASENSRTIDSSGIDLYPGPALYAIALSQRASPAAWKTDLLRKSMAYYRKWFRAQPSPQFVGWMTAACVESYLQTKEMPFAEFALEMNDWLCSLQYEQAPDPRKPLWRGGFKSMANGTVRATAPGVEAALYAQSLADCCRLVRQMPAPDVPRYDRYRGSAIRTLQFLTTLQFTEANSLHISSSYRMMLVGGFHPTHTDGNLRIDQSAACVSAFVQFLASGADRAQ